MMSMSKLLKSDWVKSADLYDTQVSMTELALGRFRDYFQPATDIICCDCFFIVDVVIKYTPLISAFSLGIGREQEGICCSS